VAQVGVIHGRILQSIVLGIGAVPDFRILILDDDELWLARHERRLTQFGFSCYATQDAREAIKVAKTDPAIKFALIDEILYVAPVPIREDERELQRWQGEGVIREITAQRSDIQIIIVTAAAQFASEKQDGDAQVFRRETARLRRRLGVIDIVHKLDIEEDPDTTYSWLIDLFRSPLLSAKAEVIKPKILIGLGFTRDEHEAMAEQMQIPRRQHMPIAPLLKKAEPVRAKLLDSLWQRSKEQGVFLEMPGSKQLDRLTGIKPGSSAFQILAFLANQAEKQLPVVIYDRDYHHTPRQSRKLGDPAPDCDPRAKQDFAFGYSSDGRKQLRLGVQIEAGAGQTSPLKVAIHRLSQQLYKLNVGPSRQLFAYNDGGYHPTFELGVVLYSLKAPRQKK
jgi:CheY-like chemotaxis protein